MSAGWLVSMSVGLGGGVASVIDGGRCSMWVGSVFLVWLAGSVSAGWFSVRCVTTGAAGSVPGALPPLQGVVWPRWWFGCSRCGRLVDLVWIGRRCRCGSIGAAAPFLLRVIGGRCSVRCARLRWWLFRSCSVSAGWLVSMSVGLGGGVASVIDGGRRSMWIGRGGVALVPALCRLAGSRYVFSKSARLALFRVLLAAPFLLCVSGLAVVVAALCRWWPLYWPLWVCCMVAPVLLSALAVFYNT